MSSWCFTTWPLREWYFGISVYRAEFWPGWNLGIWLGVRAFNIGRRATTVGG